MNKKLVFRTLGLLLAVEAVCMVPSLLIALIYGDGDALPMLYAILCTGAVAVPLALLKPRDNNLRAREGFAITGLAWIVLSIFGGLPFLFSGMFTRFEDAFFEAVSGFTTTGSTVLTVFEGQPHGIMFWRSFTHWIGGMGVLVLTLALVPKVSHASHLMRAESPGPTLSKILPKMRDTAKILYMIYIALTLAEFAALICCGLGPYDAAIHAIGTAGTGGFSNYAASVGAFDSAAVDAVITVFMLVFGVNFALYYRLLVRDVKGFLASEELKWYAGIVLAAITVITLFVLPQYGNSFFTALRYSSFQVASIVSTTGFCTADFNLWPIAVKMLILVLMFMGSCAGSTAGGMKVVRVALLTKNAKRQVLHTFQPRKVQVIRFEGRSVDEDQLRTISVFAGCYVMLILGGAFLVSLNCPENYTLQTNFTAALTCMSNVGPGFDQVGAVENFAGYGVFSKLVLSFLMLAGRLEIFPMLVIFHPGAWKRS